MEEQTEEEPIFSNDLKGNCDLEYRIVILAYE